jgi:hypothetical protein
MNQQNSHGHVLGSYLVIRNVTSITHACMKEPVSCNRENLVHKGSYQKTACMPAAWGDGHQHARKSDDFRMQLPSSVEATSHQAIPGPELVNQLL